MNRVVRIVAAFLLTYCAGLVGLFFTSGQITTWYATLQKPALTPPDFVFGPVWMVLYALMALSLCIVWLKRKQTSYTEGWVRFYFVQLLFNAAWAIFFFSLHTMFIALIDILFLAFILLSLIAGAYEIDKRAAYLLYPYLFWILFAAYLNAGFWLLN